VAKKPRPRLSGLPVTLADVAREARVSQITVSRVIRNKGAISGEMRRRVEEVIREVGYVPNRLAGSLASAGTDLVGVIVPTLRSIIFHHVLQGVNEALSAKGYRAVVASTGFDDEEEERLVTALLSWRPAAMIVAAFDHKPSTVAKLRGAGIPLIEITDIDRAPIDVSVGISYFDVGYATGKYLVERGYRRIGFIGHSLDSDRYARRRHDGFREALREAGIAIAAEKVTPNAPPHEVAHGKALLAALCAEEQDLDAVYFSNDEMAVGGFLHCLGAGIDVPGKLALMGFNAIDVGQALPTPLSSVLSNRYELGLLAGKYALARIDGQPVPPVTDVGFTLIRGATS